MNQSSWPHKVDLAAALRLAERFGLSEGVSNHVSYALDAAGDALDGDGEVERSAFVIHSRVHRACPRARCVLHTHMPYATALSLLDDTYLEPVEQNALRFYDDVAYDSGYAGLAQAIQEGDRARR